VFRQFPCNPCQEFLPEAAKGRHGLFLLLVLFLECRNNGRISASKVGACEAVFSFAFPESSARMEAGSVATNSMARNECLSDERAQRTSDAFIAGNVPQRMKLAC